MLKLFSFARETHFFLAKELKEQHNFIELEKKLGEMKLNAHKNPAKKKVQLIFEGLLAYRIERDYKKAFNFFGSALEVDLDSVIDQLLLDAYTYLKLSDCHFDLSQFKEMKKSCEKSLKLLNSSQLAYTKAGIEDYFMERFMKELRMDIEYDFAGYYIGKEQLQNAKKHIDHATVLAQELGNFRMLAKCYISLAIRSSGYQGVRQMADALEKARSIVNVFNDDFLDPFIKNMENIIQLIKMGTGSYYKGKRLFLCEHEEITNILRKVKLYSIDGMIDPLYKEKHFWKDDPKIKIKGTQETRMGA